MAAVKRRSILKPAKKGSRPPSAFRSAAKKVTAKRAAAKKVAKVRKPIAKK